MRMHALQYALLLCWSCLVGCASSSRTTVGATGGGAVSTDVFYTTLSPYGEWVSVGSYGRVWRPSPAVVGAGFRPYGPGGHWVHTDYGWSYESDWEWGWAPFHYGRWYLDQGYGWVWIPGSAWAPAWVSWRYGGGYVGWAPLPPAGSAIVIEAYHPYWCFVETRYLVVRDVYHYAMPVQNNHLAFSATVTVQQTMSHGGAYWSPGPPAAQMSREIGQPIHTATVTPPPGGAVQAHRISPSPAHATGAPSGPAVHPNAGAAHERAQGIDHGEGEHERGREGGAVEHEHEHEHPGYASPESHGQANAPPPPPAGKRKRR